MSSSDERIRVAKALRDANDTELYVMYLNEILAGVLGICPNDSYENVERKILDRLADLIDPTCEAAYDNPFASDFNYRCMACGEHFSTCGEPRYCPGCGRRIEHVK